MMLIDTICTVFMLKQSPSRIYNANQSGSTLSQWHTCFSTFNYGCFYEEGKKPFGRLLFFNEESIAPNHVQSYTCENDIVVLVIPTVGALNCGIGDSGYVLVQSEQIRFFMLKKGDSYYVANQFEKEWVNYLHFGINGYINQSCTENISFTEINKLTTICLNNHFKNGIKGFVGVFEGREEGFYKVSEASSSIFIYVLNGAFEVQNILLEHKDGLSLWDTPEIEFESLAPHSILLLIETAL